MQQRIQIPRNCIELAGVLFIPENFDETKQYPAIVVVHPSGGVKEQTAGLYAGKLAEAGFVAVAYDASHQGESGGEPRFLESPSVRVADISYVIDYLNNLPYVDNNRIGTLGICAGGGYADNAAQIDKRIKAVANVVGYRHRLAVPRRLRRRPVPDHSCHFRASGARQKRRSPRGGIDCGELCSAYIGRSGGRTICLRP